MRALRSFTVRRVLPEPLAALDDLAHNLRWSWDERTRDLFRWVDPDLWSETAHDPVRLLGRTSTERLEALAADSGFRRYLDEVAGELERYLDGPRWFQDRAVSPLRLVGYFSPEFGIAEAIPQYSGGLGVLAGDHLKAASDLGVPLVGLGLMYRHGYFRQSLASDGWQRERFPDLDPWAMALRRVEGARVEVDLAGVALVAQVWIARVGRTRLYLLDADLEENDPVARGVTDRLYGGDVEHRLRQEILLGIGGVRALEAVDEPVQVFHTNEGHAGFLGLERIRRLVSGEGLSFAEALEAVKAGTVFTTHTPVPAGIDRFPAELMARYFTGFAEELGISFEDLMALGRRVEDPPDDRFNMAVMGLRLASRSNGVARLHGEVSRAMFQNLWPDVPEAETPITSVTNGVHVPTWVGTEMREVLTRAVQPTFELAGPADWQGVLEARDSDLWRARNEGREQLVRFVRERVRTTMRARGVTGSELAWVDDVLDPRVLTVGFARRFATYKRSTLLVEQPERLRRLLLDGERPVQFVFAGKAHPADEPGKALIKALVQFASEADVRHRFVFLEDYDIGVARVLYQGCDVWLNTPRRPLEACGTSGMKSAFNGGLNCSIRDGWWDECFDGENGWAISSAIDEPDVAKRDALESESLFDLLEHQIVPLFYDRPDGPLPRRWLARVKHSLAVLGPAVSASRMVREYTERLYEPTAERVDRLGAGDYAGARALAAWKARVLAAWDEVAVVSVDADVSAADIGAPRSVRATVELGSLEPTDVEVQLLHGPVGQGEELSVADVVVMAPDDGGESRRHYRADLAADAAGRYGFTVRVVPSHPDLVGFADLGRITWAV